MEKIWTQMQKAAQSVINERRISEYVTCGEVSAAVLSKTGKIYTGVCIDTCSTLGICAERNAICNFYSNKDDDETILNLYLLASNISKTYKDIIFPCGACLQFIQEFFKENNNIICYSINKDKSVFRINDLLPNAFLLNKKKETK
jgi:homotetrameric cytidine deaminase